MRRAARVDGNHVQIVDALRAVGCRVQSLAAVGDGCPDLLVGVNGFNALIEVKDGSLPPSERRLTPAQIKWHTGWLAPVHIAYSVEQALAIADFYRKRRAA